MAIIKRTRALQDVGILANRGARDVGPAFLRYNLIYGFNGSGKSTLSRLIACLELGKQHDKLPENSRFEVEMEDGAVFRCPDALAGLETRICVFNTDFVERSVKWETGRAASIFYISEEQAEAAAQLKAKQGTLAERKEVQTARQETWLLHSKALGAHKTERARTISLALRLAGRRYEAPQLLHDYETMKLGEDDLVDEDTFRALESVVQQPAPPPTIARVSDCSGAAKQSIEVAQSLADLSLVQSTLEEMERHPEMVPWLKAGHEYHQKQNLDFCLLCANPFSEDRKAQLAAALDDRLSRLMNELTDAKAATQAAKLAAVSRQGWADAKDVDGSLRKSFASARDDFERSSEALESTIKEAERVIVERLGRPTLPVAHVLPDLAKLDAICDAFSLRLAAINKLIDQHNVAAADFDSSQTAARDRLKKHLLAQSVSDYTMLKNQEATARQQALDASTEVTQLQQQIADLTTKVRAHGAAADKITKLVRAYLGHGELTIFAAQEGYELRRHGKLVKGPPSEGEKTAIALCYFLSTLEANGRNIEDLIIVIDDPISSLDSKAMNYASSLIRIYVESAAQVFILTHNQNCMNEFKKYWRNKEKATEKRVATAAYFFVDVSIKEGADRREAELIEMPSHLKGYDSEYHFLCSKVLQFESRKDGYFEYWFMMPNVIRRVLEVFLGFRKPGSHPIEQKLDSLIESMPDLDPVRVQALHRLIQVESHSDSLDDLIEHSSMTIEETRDANNALLALMAKADPSHTELIRDQCK